MTMDGRLGTNGLLLVLVATPAAAAETYWANPTVAEIERALDPERQQGEREAAPRSRGLVVNRAAREGGESGKASVSMPIRFGFDSAELTPDARAHLDRLGGVLASDKFAATRFSIVGHTDAVGAAAYYELLSRQRTEAVARYLTERFELDRSRLTVLGMGERRFQLPRAPEDPVNRRVEIINEGRAR